MKLIYIQNSRLPTEKAHGYQIMKTCEALADSGVVLELIVPKRKNYLHDDPFEFYGVIKNFSINQVNVVDWINSVPKFLKSLAFYLEQFSFWQSVKKLPLGDGYIVYTRDSWMAGRLKKFFKIPVFLELHVMPKTQHIGAINGILCVTKWMQEELKKITKIQIGWLPDAVDLHIFDIDMTREQSRASLGIDASAKVIVYGGRFTTMEKGKGLAILDESVDRLSNSYANLQLFLIGGTEDDFIKTEGYSPSAHTTCFPGVNREKLALYYKAADVLAMPFPNTKHYAQEMSPMKMFEYMASGTPIVTSDLPSVREVLDNETAFFYAPDDADDLTNALQRALNEVDKGKSLAIKAKQKSKEFSWQERAKRIISFVSYGK